MSPKGEGDSSELMRAVYKDAAHQALDDESTPSAAAYRLAAFGQGLAGGLDPAVAEARAAMLRGSGEAERLIELARAELVSTLAALRSERGESFDESDVGAASDSDLRTRILVLRYFTAAG